MGDTNDILRQVRQVADELQLTGLRPLIAACERRLTARTGLDVAVFGRFKAGKSSFLNHLIGRPVLPIGVVPLTAVITRLRPGPEERVTVRFLDQGERRVPLADLGQYVGETENPNNEKQVAAVTVELPELERWRPLEFVDTPGLGSALAHNTEVALDWLPQVGAALVAISADAPLSERDLDLIAGLRQYTPRVVLLLTKADLLDAAQRAEVRRFVSTQLRRRWNDEPPVFFYSIRPAEARLQRALERELLTPLIRQGDQASAEIARHKLRALVHRTADYLRVARAAATQAESAREALRKRLRTERAALADFREELQVLGHQWAAGALEFYHQQLAADQQALQTRMAAGLREQFPRWRLPLPAFTRAYGEWLAAFLRRELTTLSRARRDMFRRPLEKTRQHLERALRAFQDRLAEHVQASLGLSLKPHALVLEVPEPEEPPIRVNAGFMVPMDLLGYLVPMTLVRPWVERRFLRRARWEVKKNLSRLAADWQDRIRAGIEELNAQALRQAETELATLARLADQAPDRSESLRRMATALEAASIECQAHPAPSRDNIGAAATA